MKIDIPRGWEVERNISYPNNQDELARISRYSMEDGKYSVWGNPYYTKIFLKNTDSKDFSSFVEEVKVLSDQTVNKNREFQIIKINGLDAVLVNMDRWRLGLISDLYIFTEGGEYLLITEIYHKVYGQELKIPHF